MVKVNDNYYDGHMISFLDQLIAAVSNKWDGLIYLGGMEGAGKTTLGLQIGSYLDPNFNINNIVFSGESFVTACVNAKPKTAIVFDESYSVFNNRNFANKLTNKIISMLTMIRSKQLYLIIISPTFFDLSKYLIVHRSRAFINVYSNDMKRGFFSFFNYEKKLELYYKGKKDHNMRVVQPLFRGRFTKWSPVNLDEYEKRKQQAIEELAQDKKKKETVLSTEHIESLRLESNFDFINFCKNSGLLKFGALTRIADNYFKMSDSALSRRLSKREISRSEKFPSSVPEIV